MKKYLFIIAAAATCLLVACSKEKELRAPEADTETTTASEFVHLPGWTYVGASNLEDSKASITNDATPVFKWNAGDKIALFTDNNDYLVSAGLDNSFDNATEAEFAFEGTGIDAHRAFFAVYPASLVSGCANPTANSLAINLPASYTLAQVQGEVSPIPMVAANAPGDPLAFKSICALLRITVKNIAKDAQSIKVRFPGQKVNGAFALADFVAGTSGVAGAASSSEAEETITITDLNLNNTFTEQLVINIPVPMGAFNNAVLTACDASGLKINYISTPVKVNKVDPDDQSTWVPVAWSPGRKSRRTLTANLPVFTVSGASIEAADRKMIVFAPGNLEAKLDVVPKVTLDKNGARYNNCSKGNFGTASEWRFHAKQYESIRNYIPEGRTYSLNGLEESIKGDYTDLFCWTGADAGTNLTNLGPAYLYGIFYGGTNGTSGYIGGASESPATTLGHDWGENEIKYGEGDDEITYPANTWRTPTADEWEFVFINRKLASTLRIKQGGMAMIIESDSNPSVVAYGMILLPDNYSHPYGVKAFVKFYEQSNKSYNGNGDSYGEGAICSENTYTLDDWQKLDAAGCVFLPTTDMRTFNADPALQTNNAGNGIYWSSTHRSTSMAWALAFCCPEAGRCGSYNGGGSVDAPISNIQFKTSRGRYYNQAVRLVRDVN